MWEKITSFLQDVFQELKRVTWPTKDVVVDSTVVVLFVMGVVAVFLWAVDLLLQRLISGVLG